MSDTAAGAARGGRRARVTYLVHDLNDAAVARRVRMLQAGGLTVELFGFSRLTPPNDVHGAPAVCLGRTHDGRLVHRSLAVLRALIRVRRQACGRDVVLARNLESLVLAVVASRGQRIVYECLDIHRTLTGTGTAARVIRWVERMLLRRTDLVLTSSPRFVTEHFDTLGVLRNRPVLIENKVLAIDGVPIGRALPRTAAGPPWVIGWFGMIRCRRSLAMLSTIAATSAGRIEVIIAGRPSPAEFEDFDATVAALPGVRFVGAYTADDLPRLYRDVHFAWAIDYFEEGLNSTWLLPNRLYEATFHGAVPIALHDVETGAWLDRHGAGLIVGDPAIDVGDCLSALDSRGYDRMCDAVDAIPRIDLVITCDACVDLAQIVGGGDDVLG